MKKINLNICVLSISLLFTTHGSGQNISFSYDATGNRSCRTISIIKEGTATRADTVLSDTTSVLKNQVTGTFNIAVYPNPATDFIQVQTDGFTYDTILEAFMYSSNGELLNSFRINEPNQRISLAMYAPGLYFLKIPVNHKIESWKIIIQ